MNNIVKQYFNKSKSPKIDINLTFLVYSRSDCKKVVLLKWEELFLNQNKESESFLEWCLPDYKGEEEELFYGNFINSLEEGVYNANFEIYTERCNEGFAPGMYDEIYNYLKYVSDLKTIINY